MALASAPGHSHALFFRTLKLPSISSHTRIVHLLANLRSLFNVIYHRSNSLLHAAAHCPSMLKPFSVTPPSHASHFVVTTTCLVIIISSNILKLLRTISSVLWWLDLWFAFYF